MIKPDELDSERPYGPLSSRGCDVWDAICAALSGDVAELRRLIELLLARGAATNLADDAPWAAPLAWATRRGHDRVIAILRAAGATA